MNYDNPAQILNEAINVEINRHLSSYPQDINYLEQYFGLEIIEEKFVWISPNSNKFHFNSSCSGLKNAKKVTVEELDVDRYLPCKRCVKPK